MACENNWELSVTSLIGESSKVKIVFDSVTHPDLQPDRNTKSCLVISAFRNNYNEMGVIGALRKDLGIAVKNLAESPNIHKEETIREFNCWSSQTNDNQSFKCLVVYEPHRMNPTQIPNDISNVFRFLGLQVSNYLESVTCVLLATNSQNADKVQVFKSIIENCILSIRCGVLIRNFILSVFGSDENWRRQFQHEFQIIRERYEAQLDEHSQSVSRVSHLLVFDNASYNYIASNEDLASLTTGSQYCLCKIDEYINNRLNLMRNLKLSDKAIVYNRREFYTSEVAKFVCFLLVVLQKSRNKEYMILDLNSAAKLPFTMLRNFYSLIEIRELDEADLVTFTRNLIQTPSQRENREGHQQVDERETLGGAAVNENYNVLDKLNHVKLLRYLSGDRIIDICIIFNTNSRSDFYTAAELADRLRRLGFIVFRRNFNPTDNGYENTEEVKETFSAMHRSKVIIALVNYGFITNFICRLEYTLALCCHASHRYPAQFVPILTDGSLESRSVISGGEVSAEMEECPQDFDAVFLIEHMIKLVSGKTNEEYLGHETIGELSNHGFVKENDTITVTLRGISATIENPTNDTNVDNSRGFNGVRHTNDVNMVIISCDIADRRLADLIASNIAEHTGTAICTGENGRASILKELEEHMNDKLVVLYLLSNEFLRNDNNTIDTIYELFRAPILGECVPRVRCVLTNSCSYNDHVPMFIRRLPLLIRMETEVDEQLLVDRISNWIYDNRSNTNPTTLIEPKSNFDNKCFPNKIKVIQSVIDESDCY